MLQGRSGERLVNDCESSPGSMGSLTNGHNMDYWLLATDSVLSHAQYRNDGLYLS